jgi:hypothetical protein
MALGDGWRPALAQVRPGGWRAAAADGKGASRVVHIVTAPDVPVEGDLGAAVG